MPYFKIDNDIFSLHLDPFEFQIYTYLGSCAGKKASAGQARTPSRVRSA